MCLSEHASSVGGGLPCCCRLCFSPCQPRLAPAAWPGNAQPLSPGMMPRWQRMLSTGGQVACVSGQRALQALVCGYKQDSGLPVRPTISGCTVRMQAVKREADKAWACVQAECQSLLAELLAAPSLRTFTRAAARPGDLGAGQLMHA